MSDQITLTERPPVACASCFGQYPQRRHVDFHSDYDGPTLPPDAENVAGGKFLSIDDLIICEECLSAAAALVGLASADELKAEVADLRATAAELTEKYAGAMAYIQQLEAEQQARKNLIEAIKA